MNSTTLTVPLQTFPSICNCRSAILQAIASQISIESNFAGKKKWQEHHSIQPLSFSYIRHAMLPWNHTFSWYAMDTPSVCRISSMSFPLHLMRGLAWYHLHNSNNIGHVEFLKEFCYPLLVHEFHEYNPIALASVFRLSGQYSKSSVHKVLSTKPFDYHHQ